MTRQRRLTAHASSMADTKDSGEFQFACIVGDLRVMQSSLFTKKPTEDEGAQNTECRCLRMEINGRSIVIFMVGDDKLFAMDQKCYRKQFKLKSSLTYY